MKTLIPALDKALLGLPPITIIQGPPKSNKSTLCLQIAHNVAKQGYPVLIFDCENGKERLRARLMCQANGVDWVEAITSTTQQEERLAEPVSLLPIYPLVDSFGPEDILALAKAAYEFHKKPVLIVGDSIQAFPRIAPGEDQRVNLEEWMKFFDRCKLKYEGKITFLLTSEKRRGSYEDASIDGGKGSNAIEYKAECLLDLRREVKTDTLILQSKAFRDGLSDFRIKFRKVLANPANDQSFTFLLEEIESGGGGGI